MRFARRVRSHSAGIPIAAALLACLASSPLGIAAGARAIGVVITSTAASSASAPLIEGGTLTVGDSIHTDRGGGARLRLGRGTQLSLGGSTAVRFRSESDRVIVELTAGATMTRDSGHDAVALETAGYRIEPARQARAIYVVAMLPDKTDVAARLGNVTITDASGGQTVVNEGEVAEIMTSPNPGGPQDQESGKEAPGKTSGQESTPQKRAPKAASHTGIIILAGAAAAAVGIGLAVAAGGGGGQPPSSPAAP